MALTTQTRIVHRHLDADSTSSVERVLQAEAKRLRELVGRLKVELEGGDRPDPAVSEPDAAAYRLELVDLLVRSQERLGELTDALTRINHGTYGTGEACGRPIPAARVEAIPESRLCVACASTATVRSTSLLPFTLRRSNASDR